jgi:hypothetical protein
MLRVLENQSNPLRSGEDQFEGPPRVPRRGCKRQNLSRTSLDHLVAHNLITILGSLPSSHQEAYTSAMLVRAGPDEMTFTNITVPV